MHLHKDVDEVLKVLNGSGYFHSQGDEKKERFLIGEGAEIYIPKSVPHAFAPEPGTCLEIRVACSGILDPKKEVTVVKFDNYLREFDSPIYKKINEEMEYFVRCEPKKVREVKAKK